MDKSLHTVARIVATQYLGLSESNEIVIVTDEDRLRIADAIAVAALGLRAHPIVVCLTETARRGPEIKRGKISPPLLRVLERADVGVVLLGKRDEESEFRRNVVNLTKGTPLRVAALPGITEAAFVKYLKTYPKALTKRAFEIARLILKSSQMRVKTKAGTDLRIKLRRGSRPPRLEISSGLILSPSSWGNLPAGEIYFVPFLGQVEGTLVVDVGFSKGMPRKPVSFEIHHSKVDRSSIESSDKRALETIRSVVAIRNADLVAEFGLGLNPNIVRPIGTSLVDEKIMGTAHLALGDNTPFGGPITSKIHFDMIFSRPTIVLDDVNLMTNGRFSYRTADLANSVGGYPGRLVPSTIVSVAPRTACFRYRNQLLHVWRGAAGRTHVMPIGDEYSSALASRVWHAVRYGGSSIEQVARRSHLGVSTVAKTVELMISHDVLEVEPA